MSLNDKYIINGSTLSAIGDALREAGVSTRIVTEKKYYKTDMTGGDERTIQASLFTGLNSTPTQAFIRVTRVDDTGVITSPIRQALNVGDQLILPLPFKYKGYATTSYGSTVNYYAVLNIYPLDAEGNFMIPENTTGYTAIATNREQILPILVQDIPSKIQTINRIALIAPFTIPSSRNLAAATVLPDAIQEITDIKKLIMIEGSPSSSYIRLSMLEPSTASTSHYSNIGGDIQKAGTAYHMKYHDFSYSAAATANWEDTIKASSTKHNIYFNKATRQLIQLDNSSYTYNAVAGPVILMY